MHKRAIFVALALMATAGCADLTGPPAEAPFCEVAAPVEVAADHDGAVEVGMMRQSPSIPLLETYERSFWAVRGQASHVVVRHARGGQGRLADAHAGVRPGDDIFLSLDIPPEALAYHRDGSRVRRGERVLITITIDRRSLVINFAPAGLTFSRLSPAQLYLPYASLEEEPVGLWRPLAAFDAAISGWNFARGNKAGVSENAEDSTAQQASGSCAAQLSDVAVSW